MADQRFFGTKTIPIRSSSRANGGYGRAAFYAYAAPVPEGLDKAVLSGKGGFNSQMGEFILDYADARNSEDPVDTVLEFLQETYSAAADAAKWDRESLDRRDEVVEAIRLRYPQRQAIPLDE